MSTDNTARLVQETFETTEKRTTQSGMERTWAVRQDRFQVSNAECFLSISGTQYEVMNYSSFGIAIFLDKEFSFDGALNAELTLEGVEVGQLNVRMARHEKLPNGHKYGFEILGEPLSVVQVNSILGASQLTRAHREELESIGQVPEAFRQRVYEVKDALERLETRVDALQEGQSFGSNYEIHAFENTVAKVVTRYLFSVFEGTYDKFAQALNGLEDESLKACFEFYRAQLKHLIYQAPFARRAIEKPLGYSGDYEMMNSLYRNEAVGKSLFAKCLNYYFLNHPYSNAVRNRARYLKNKLVATIENRDRNKITKILSVACGPTKELELLMQEKIDLTNVEFHLLDQDLGALREAQRNIKSLSRSLGVELNAKFFHKAIKNVISENLSEQYDMIYSAGLFDYFSDGVARAAAKRLHSALTPNGKLVVGNYTAAVRAKLQMEFALDWFLIYRSEADLKHLYTGIGEKLLIESEPEQVNLFVVIGAK